jgi:peptidoglycan hydrolase CwlO-like protein
MVVVTNSWRVWAIGMAVSLLIFGVVFFTVIKPSTDTANQAVKSGIQQSQQVLSQAQKQISSATGQAGATSGQAGAAAGQAQQTVNRAAKLASCLASAGIDSGKIQACQSQYGG